MTSKEIVKETTCTINTITQLWKAMLFSHWGVIAVLCFLLRNEAIYVTTIIFKNVIKMEGTLIVNHYR